MFNFVKNFVANVDNLMLDFFIDVDSKDTRIVSGGKSQSAESGGGKIAGIFSAIQKSINPELVTKTDAVFQFNVKGKSIIISHTLDYWNFCLLVNLV